MREFCAYSTRKKTRNQTFFPRISNFFRSIPSAKMAGNHLSAKVITCLKDQFWKNVSAATTPRHNNPSNRQFNLPVYDSSD